MHQRHHQWNKKASSLITTPVVQRKIEAQSLTRLIPGREEAERLRNQAREREESLLPVTNGIRDHGGPLTNRVCEHEEPLSDFSDYETLEEEEVFEEESEEQSLTGLMLRCKEAERLRKDTQR